MSIAFNAARSAVGSSVMSVTTPSWAISGSNRCMVGALMWHDAPLGANYYNYGAMRWGGSTGTLFTQFGSTLFYQTNTMALATARLIAPAAATRTLYGEVTNNIVTRLFVGAANYTGVRQTSPLGTPVDSPTNGQSSNPSINVTITSDDRALAWLITGGTAITPGGSQNQRWEVENIYSVSGDDRTGSGSVALSWTTSGSDNTFLARAVALRPVARVLTANSGSYALSGTAAPLRFGRRVQAAGGSYTITGTDASLIYAGTNLKLVADPGSYIITGTNAPLLFGRNVQANSGSYTITGASASLLFGRKVQANSGSYLLTGTDASLLFGRKVQAASGAYIITGTNASLLLGRKVQAAGGSYAINGIDASLLLGRKVQADGGSYLIIGTDASFIYTGANRTLVANPGSYIITGTNASLLFTQLLSADVGVYAISGRTVELEYSATPTPFGDFLIFLRRRRRD